MVGKFAWGVTWRTVLVAGLVATPLWYFNREAQWSGEEVYAAGDTAVVGKPGIVVVALMQPEQYDPKFFVHFLDKLFSQAIPWPINELAGRDNGVVLVDPSQPYMSESFKPVSLVDIEGNTADRDGVAWIEKYRRGEIRWEPALDFVPHDFGVFVYPERLQGMRFPAAKTSAKARYVYHAALPGGYLPHYRQTYDMAQGAIDLLKAQHPQIVAGAVADAFDPEAKRAAVERVLDAGADTIVLASAQPVYSGFEDLDGSFVQVRKIIEEWRARNGGKPIKIVIPPDMASTGAYERLLLDHFAAQVPPATAPGQLAVAILTNHGLPVELMGTDGWSQRIPKVAERLIPQVEAILRSTGYDRVEARMAAEGFADDIEDPDNKIVSVREQFRKAQSDGAAVAVAMPLEFMAENTDTLFAHAALMFEGFPGYETYQAPPADIDWSQPYVREFQMGKTRALYIGSPGGATVPRQAKAFAEAIGKVFD